MRVNRFVFLNRPRLSLEVHLGVTASPQTPFPVDYVTGRGPDRYVLVRHSSQTRGMQGLQRRLAFAGRTKGNVDSPHVIGVGGRNVLQ